MSAADESSKRNYIVASADGAVMSTDDALQPTAFPITTMSAIFESIDLAVLVLDEDLRISFVNDRYIQILNLDAELCRAGQDFVALLPALCQTQGQDQISAVSAFDERLAPIQERRRTRLIRTSSDSRILEEVGAPLHCGGYSYTITDITERYFASSRLKAANRATIQALAGLAEFRDTDTGDHVIRVARMTQEIARTLEQSGVFAGLITKDFRAQIGVASMLHDIGKVAVRDVVLRKPGFLEPEERKHMQIHSTVGGSILDKALTLAPESSYLRLAAEIARFHHERFDGKGYPDGLAGENIPLAARIVAVADVFDALTSERPYKEAWSEDKAILYLAEQSGQQFDPHVIAAALEVLEDRRQTPIIRWSESMSVGDAVLDRDHRALIGLVNQLSLPANRHDRAVLEFVLDELLDYTVAHFSREEEYMRGFAFSDYDRHVSIHRALTNQLVDIRNNFITGNRDMGTEVADFAAAWLRKHIMQEDQRYRAEAAAAAKTASE
jgi:hemerythrin-like metal-binding protein